jgi:hypothetical protein
MFMVGATLGESIIPVLIGGAMSLFGPNAFQVAAIVAAGFLAAIYLLVNFQSKKYMSNQSGHSPAELTASLHPLHTILGEDDDLEEYDADHGERKQEFDQEQQTKDSHYHSHEHLEDDEDTTQIDQVHQASSSGYYTINPLDEEDEAEEAEEEDQQEIDKEVDYDVFKPELGISTSPSSTSSYNNHSPTNPTYSTTTTLSHSLQKKEMNHEDYYHMLLDDDNVNAHNQVVEEDEEDDRKNCDRVKVVSLDDDDPDKINVTGSYEDDLKEFFLDPEMVAFAPNSPHSPAKPLSFS